MSMIRRYRREPKRFGACSAEYQMAVNQWNAAWFVVENSHVGNTISTRSLAMVIPFLEEKMSEEERQEIRFWDWPT